MSLLFCLGALLSYSLSGKMTLTRLKGMSLWSKQTKVPECDSSRMTLKKSLSSGIILSIKEMANDCPTAL